MRTKTLVTIIIGFAIILICAGIFKQEFILSLFGIVFALEGGWGYKLLSSLNNFPGGNYKTIEHWKIFPSLFLMIISLIIVIFALNINSYVLGFFSIIPSFFCGFNVKISYKKENI